MDYFKEYGKTKQEIISDLSDAIRRIDEPYLIERLEEDIEILERAWDIAENIPLF